MTGPRTMASLAVDALRQLVGKSRPVSLVVQPRPRIGVVTGHALFVDDSSKVLVRRTVIAGAHCPDATLFRIPADRQLDEPAIGISMKERSRVVARTDDEIRRQLEDIGFPVVDSKLMSPLSEDPVVLCDRVVALRRIVMETNRFGGPSVIGPDPGERTSHSSETKGAGDLAVTACTLRRIDVRVSRLGMRRFAWRARFHRAAATSRTDADQRERRNEPDNVRSRQAQDAPYGCLRVVFQLFQKMKVPRLVAVMISGAPSLLRSTAATFEPTPERL